MPPTTETPRASAVAPTKAAGLRLRNLPVGSLPPHLQGRVVLRSLVRQYTSSLLARVGWKVIRAERARTLEGHRAFARALRFRPVEQLPDITPGQQTLPAATLAQQQRDLLDRPRLRLFSGVEVPVDIPYHVSTHEFYQLARNALNLAPNERLRILRLGSGTLEQRELRCNGCECGHLIRRKTFQVITHE